MVTREELAKALKAAWDTLPIRAFAAERWEAVADKAIELLGHPAKPAARVPVQFWVNSEGFENVLCNDGTTWWWSNTTNKWNPLFGPIPQPGEPA